MTILSMMGFLGLLCGKHMGYSRFSLFGIIPKLAALILLSWGLGQWALIAGDWVQRNRTIDNPDYLYIGIALMSGWILAFGFSKIQLYYIKKRKVS